MSINHKNRAFTLVEVLLVTVLFAIVVSVLVFVYTSINKSRHELGAITALNKETNTLFEHINYASAHYTIDYEEYWNRSRVGCDVTDWTNFSWDVNANGYCDKFTAYGNHNSVYSDKSSQPLLYTCSSEEEGTISYPKIFKNTSLLGQKNWCFSHNQNWQQAYGQYKWQFWDMMTGGVNQGNEEFLGKGPIAIDDFDHVKELYLISRDGTQRLFFRRHCVDSTLATSGKKCGIQILKLRAFDAGVKHSLNNTSSDNWWKYDGTIDTWACDTAQGFVCGNNTDPIVAEIDGMKFRMPKDIDDGWKDLISDDVNIQDWNIVISTAKDPKYSAQDPNFQVVPYAKVALTNTINREKWWGLVETGRFAIDTTTMFGFNGDMYTTDVSNYKWDCGKKFLLCPTEVSVNPNPAVTELDADGNIIPVDVTIIGSGGVHDHISLYEDWGTVPVGIGEHSYLGTVSLTSSSNYYFTIKNDKLWDFCPDVVAEKKCGMHWTVDEGGEIPVSVQVKITKSCNVDALSWAEKINSKIEVFCDLYDSVTHDCNTMAPGSPSSDPVEWKQDNHWNWQEDLLDERRYFWKNNDNPNQFGCFFVCDTWYVYNSSNNECVKNIDCSKLTIQKYMVLDTLEGVNKKVFLEWEDRVPSQPFYYPYYDYQEDNFVEYHEPNSMKRFVRLTNSSVWKEIPYSPMFSYAFDGEASGDIHPEIKFSFSDNVGNVIFERTCSLYPDDLCSDDGVSSPYIVEHGIIIGYNGAAVSLIIPSVIEGQNIIGIWPDVFKEKGLRSVEIPDGVTSIWTRAFARNQLINVKIPDTVKSIWDAAFFSNNLSTVIIPDGVETIWNEVFVDNKLTTLEIPSSVKSIWDQAFVANRLSELTLSDGIETIWTSAFAWNKLTNVKIPSSMTTIWKSVFFGNQLTGVVIPNTIRSIWVSAFANNVLENIHLPDSVEEIWVSAFRWNQLKSAMIPDSIRRIWVSAFADNVSSSVIGYISGNKKIPLYGNHSQSKLRLEPCGDWTFWTPKACIEAPLCWSSSGQHLTVSPKDRLCRIGTPVWVDETGSDGTYNWICQWEGSEHNKVSCSAFRSCFGFNTDTITSYNSHCWTYVVIPSMIDFSPVRRIWDFVFRNRGLKAVDIPNGIVHIWKWAFLVNQFTGVKIPDTVEYIWESAFASNQLKNVKISSNVKMILTGTFSNNKLTSVQIPYGVKKIWSSAFYMNHLKSVIIPNSVESIWSRAFIRNKLVNLILPNSLKYIWINAFYGNQLESVEIPNNIQTIWKYAFARNKLKNVKLSSHLKTIWIGAFSYNHLTNVTIPYGVENIWLSAFFRNKLVSLVLPNSLKYIWNYAFYGNQLESVKIPNSVQTIWKYAFYRNKLSKIIVPDSITSIWYFSFARNLSNSVLGYISGNKDKSAYGNHSNSRLRLDYCPAWTVWTPEKCIDVARCGTSHWQQFTHTPTVWLCDVWVMMWMHYSAPDHSYAWICQWEGPQTNQVNCSASRSYFGFSNGSITSYGQSNTDVVIPETINGTSVTVVWTGVFYEKNITSVEIPASVEYIWRASFLRSRLSSLKLSSGLKYIWDNAFTKTKLKHVEIPDTVKVIGRGAFYRNRLEYVHIPNKLVSISTGVFYGNRLKHVKIPDSVKSIWLEAFSRNLLEDIVIPSSVENIWIRAFSYNKLKSVTIPSDVKNIWKYAFYRNLLKDVIISDGVKKIWDYAFSYNQLRTVMIPDSVVSIWNGAFYRNYLKYRNKSIIGYISGNKDKSKYGNHKYSKIILKPCPAWTVWTPTECARQ